VKVVSVLNFTYPTDKGPGADAGVLNGFLQFGEQIDAININKDVQELAAIAIPVLLGL
jgi:hypothetical protein